MLFFCNKNWMNLLLELLETNIFIVALPRHALKVFWRFYSFLDELGAWWYFSRKYHHLMFLWLNHSFLWKKSGNICFKCRMLMYFVYFIINNILISHCSLSFYKLLGKSRRFTIKNYANLDVYSYIIYIYIRRRFIVFNVLQSFYSY